MILCTRRMCTWSIYPYLISIFWLSNSEATAKDDTEYCELDVFQPSCAPNEVILMKTALYGRMALGRCIRQDLGFMGCKADVLNILDGFCSGRQSCSVDASDRSLVTAKSAVCPAGVSGYLAPSYTCQKVQRPDGNNCQTKQFFAISSRTGYISSNVASEHSCPFRLMVSSGRKVNISMMNFPPPPSKSGVSSSACYEIGSIREGDKLKTIHKCLNDPRHKQLYMSNGGQMEIDIPHKESHDVAGHFLIHFEAGAGCPDPKIPKNAEMQRTGNQALVKCSNGNHEWVLECTGDTWDGEVGDCVESSESGWSFLGLFDHEHPFGTAIVVGIGATLGVLIGGILLYIIIAIFKKCQKSDYVMTYEYTDPSFAHIPTDYHADKSNLLLQDDKLFEQNSNTWGSQRHGNSNTLSRGGGTDHSRVPLPPLPNDNNTLSYEKPLYNRNGNV